MGPPPSENLKGLAGEIFAKTSPFKERFLQAMEDDFNTAEALGYVHDLARSLNRAVNDRRFRQDPAAFAILDQGRRLLLEGGAVLGLLRETPEGYFSGQRKRFLEAKSLDEKEIREMIVQRAEARKSKDWARADEIRTRASSMGISFEDGPQGTTWRPA